MESIMKNKLIIISGSGVSEPSGIHSFRSKDGMWNKKNINKVCNFENWQLHYISIHNFYSKIRSELNNKIPNKFHYKVKEWQEKFGTNRVINITQNIDNLFEKAGVKNTLHIHGYLTEIKCMSCNNIFDIGETVFNYNGEFCKKCFNNNFKPNIVFFMEPTPNYYYLNKRFRNIKDNDIILYVGASGIIININHQLEVLKDIGIKSTHILNNLEKNEYIDEKYFNYIFYEDCIKSLENIENIILKKMK